MYASCTVPSRRARTQCVCVIAVLFARRFSSMVILSSRTVIVVCFFLSFFSFSSYSPGGKSSSPTLNRIDPPHLYQAITNKRKWSISCVRFFFTSSANRYRLSLTPCLGGRKKKYLGGWDRAISQTNQHPVTSKKRGSYRRFCRVIFKKMPRPLFQIPHLCSLSFHLDTLLSTVIGA